MKKKKEKRVVVWLPSMEERAGRVAASFLVKDICAATTTGQGRGHLYPGRK